MVGNFEEAPPTPAQLAAVKQLVATLKEAYGSGDLERMIEVRDSQCPMKGMTCKVVCRA